MQARTLLQVLEEVENVLPTQNSHNSGSDLSTSVVNPNSNQFGNK